VTVSDDFPGPLNFNTGRLANSVLVPGRIVVYGVTLYSSNAAAQWFQFFDANTIPADGAVPLFVWNMSAHAGIGFGWQPNGRQFQTGLVICTSSTEATKTINATADSFFDVQFDVYAEQNAPGTGA
jgi:hypothetical protein